jgi:N-acetylmuramoyl-L-alanine amidase
VRFHWLLSGFVGVFLFCSPARAGKLVSWEFKEQDSNLAFTTDEGVQPKAQLLSNPTRLVIDLPDTTLERETVKQSYQGPISGFRVGQPESDTSRIVVEFAPGYTVESDDIKFKGDSSTDWQVEIPQPNVSRIDTASDNDDDAIDLELPEVDISESEDDSQEASTIAMANSPHIKATRNGFLIDIDGSRKIKIDS